MVLLETIKSVSDIVNKFIPDGAEKNRLQAELEKASLEVDKQRLGALSNMLGSNSFFVAGAIPSILWVLVISIVNNYILMPWVSMFGGTVPHVDLPGQVWTLAGWIISGLLAKKAVDGNAFYSKDGTLIKPSRSEPALNMLDTLPTHHQATQTPTAISNTFEAPQAKKQPSVRVIEDNKITIEPDQNVEQEGPRDYDKAYNDLIKKYNIS